MAWADAGQRLEAMPTAGTGRDFAVSNRSVVSTPATAACRCRYQSLTAGSMIYDHVSIKLTTSALPLTFVPLSDPRSPPRSVGLTLGLSRQPAVGGAARLLAHLGTHGVVATLPISAITPWVAIPVHALPLGRRMGEPTPCDAPV